MKLKIAHICILGFATATSITEIIVACMQHTHAVGIIFGSLGIINTFLCFFFLFDKEEKNPSVGPNLNDELVAFQK